MATTTLTKEHKPPSNPVIVWGSRALWVNMVLCFFFLYFPIVVLIAFSFNDSKLSSQWSGFTLKWYSAMLENEEALTAFRNSLFVATCSTVLSTIIGTMTALAMERFRFSFRKLYDGVLYLPVIIPDIVQAVALLAFYALVLEGLNSVLGLTGANTLRLGLPTVIFSHVSYSISFVVIVVRTSLRDFDKSLEEAAQDLGADEWTTFWRVTFPLILPGILGGALLAFTLSLDDFVISFFTTGPSGTTLPILVFGLIRRAVSPEINAISTVMMTMSIVLIILSQWLQNKSARK
jgi:spermidine/putrescine transport system permease protein